LRTQGLPIVRIGEIVLNEVKRRGLPVTPDYERLVRKDLQRLHGMDVCARFALPRIRAQLAEHPTLVLDGLYSLSEYTVLRGAFPQGLAVLAVFTSKTLRYQRLATRRERPLTSAEAATRDLLEVEHLEKGGPIALADFTVVNDGTPQQLVETAARLRPVIAGIPIPGRCGQDCA
jgi:dephospho-CoA kinase